MTQKKYFFILPLLIFTNSIFYIQGIKAQEYGKNSLSFGFGFYEAFNIGYKHNYRPNLGFGVSIGYQFGIIKNQQYYNLTIQHDWTFRRKNKELSTWSLDKKLVFWYLEDKYYKWFVLSMEPAIEKTFLLNDRLGIYLDAGPVFMVVLYFKRKTFEEVGWPRYFLLNASMKVVYKLK
jgi:hypothetical protein